jgi:hypothetical protein
MYPVANPLANPLAKALRRGRPTQTARLLRGSGIRLLRAAFVIARKGFSRIRGWQDELNKRVNE